MQKRKEKSSSLSANARKRWDNKNKQKQCKGNAIASKKHMPIDYENDNENEDSLFKELAKKFNFLNDPKFKELWDAFLEMRKACKAKPTAKAVDLLLKELHGQSLKIACGMLEQSIKNNWKGVFPPKGGTDGKRTSVVAGWAAKRGIDLTENNGPGPTDTRGTLPGPENDRGTVVDLGRNA